MKTSKMITVAALSAGISCLCSCEAFMEGFNAGYHLFDSPTRSKSTPVATGTYTGGYAARLTRQIAEIRKQNEKMFRELAAAQSQKYTSPVYQAPVNTGYQSYSITPSFTPSITPSYTPPAGYSNPYKPYMDYLDRKQKLIESGTMYVPRYAG